RERKLDQLVLPPLFGTRPRIPRARALEQIDECRERASPGHQAERPCRHGKHLRAGTTGDISVYFGRCPDDYSRPRLSSSHAARAAATCEYPGRPAHTRSWNSPAPGVLVRTSTNSPRASRRAAVRNGSTASRPRYGLTVSASASKARNAASA